MTISISHTHQHRYVPTNGLEKGYLLVELKGNSAENQLRSPINLAIVLDRSGSMTGKPLQYAKEAIKFVINQLTEVDLLSVVVFDDQVETVFGPEKVIHKDSLKDRIYQIETRGMTNLSGGLIQGCQHVLKQNTNEYINRVIILSDGNANNGITDHNHLMKVVDDYQMAGVSISSIGVSDHFDEELMEGIAEHGKGNFYFIDEVEGIPAIFAEELEGLLSVVAQNVTLTINEKGISKIQKIYGYPTEKVGGLYKLVLGDMYAGEVKSVLVEYSLLTSIEGQHEVFDLEWTFVDITDCVKDYTFYKSIPIHFTMDIDLLSGKTNAYVEKQIQITKSASTIDKAMKLFDSGNFEEGKDLLKKQAVHMSLVAESIHDEELKKESEQLMEKLNQFEYSKKTRKELHHQRYRQMKRR